MADARFLKVWDDVIIKIQEFAADATSRTEAKVEEFDFRLDTELMPGMPTTPQAWQRLVQDNKVPLRLGKACCKLADIPWCHALYLAIRPWSFLLQAATMAGIIHEDDNAFSGTPVSSTALAIGQQLLQSGLLRRLPALITTTAERLQAAAGLPAAAGAAAGAAQSDRPALTTEEEDGLNQLAFTANMLKEMCAGVSLLWSQEDYYQEHCPRLVAPLGHLAMASMQYLSTEMQQPGATPSVRHCVLLHCASTCVYNCVAGAAMSHACDAPGMASGLDLEPDRANYLLQCICLASTTAAIRGALPADLTALATDSSSNYYAAAGFAGMLQRMGRLWEPCCSMANAVPDVCSDMLQLLGCNRQAGLWAAAGGDLVDINHSVSMAHCVLENLCSAQLQNPNSPRSWNRQAVKAALPLFWQLPAVALLWAHQHPTGTKGLDTEYVLACNSAAGVSGKVFYHSLRLQHVVRRYSINDQSGLVVNEGDSRAPLPAVYLDVAQPLLCKILTQLLQLQRSSVAQSSTGSNSRAGSSLPAVIRGPSGTRAPSSQSSLPLTAVVDTASTLLHVMVQHSMRPDACMVCVDDASHQLAVARQLCAVFEDVVRGQSEAYTTPGRPTGPVTLDTAPALRGLPGFMNGEIVGWETGPLVDPILAVAEPQVLPAELFSLLTTMVKVAGDSGMRQVLEAASAVARRVRGDSSTLPCNAPTGRQYVEFACCVAGKALEKVLYTGTPWLVPVDCQAATIMLPWLTLLGRGCLFYGAELQTFLLAAAQGQPTATDRSGSAAACMAACNEFVGHYKHRVAPIASVVEACLGGSSSAAAHLSSLGYDLPPLMQQLERVRAALQAAASASGAEQCLAANQDLSAQLTAFGNLLSSLAHPYACNNPRCGNKLGPSEVQLIVGRSTLCGGCRTARFCCKACLKQHWQQHKPVCKSLAASASAAGSVSS